MGYAKGTDCDVARIARAYELPEQAVEAAVAYYRQHPAVVGACLEVNAAADARKRL